MWLALEEKESCIGRTEVGVCYRIVKGWHVFIRYRTGGRLRVPHQSIRVAGQLLVNRQRLVVIDFSSGRLPPTEIESAQDRHRTSSVGVGPVCKEVNQVELCSSTQDAERADEWQLTAGRLLASVDLVKEELICLQLLGQSDSFPLALIQMVKFRARSRVEGLHLQPRRSSREP